MEDIKKMWDREERWTDEWNDGGKESRQEGQIKRGLMEGRQEG